MENRFSKRSPYGSNTGYSGYQDEDTSKTTKVLDPVLKVVNLFKKQPKNVKVAIGVAGAIATLFILWFAVENHDTFFILAEVAHFLGISILIYSMLGKRNCGGLSLRSQELTAVFLTVRLYCSFFMEYDIHTLLDFLTLVATCFVIYMMRFPLRHTYKSQDDSLHPLIVVAPCALLAVFVHPATSHIWANRVLWALCVYLEAVSVIPQLVMFRNAKIVERFAAHYLFALGVARYLACAHWILQLVDHNKHLLRAMGSGLWPVMVLLAEIVQTFVLAEFTYLYVKSYAEGTGVMRLPTNIV